MRVDKFDDAYVFTRVNIHYTQHDEPKGSAASTAPGDELITGERKNTSSRPSHKFDCHSKPASYAQNPSSYAA
jgi:hypothetical protein